MNQKHTHTHMNDLEYIYMCVWGCIFTWYASCKLIPNKDVSEWYKSIQKSYTGLDWELYMIDTNVSISSGTRC